MALLVAVLPVAVSVGGGAPVLVLAFAVCAVGTRTHIGDKCQIGWRVQYKLFIPSIDSLPSSFASYFSMSPPPQQTRRSAAACLLLIAWTFISGDAATLRAQHQRMCEGLFQGAVVDGGWDLPMTVSKCVCTEVRIPRRAPVTSVPFYVCEGFR